MVQNKKTLCQGSCPKFNNSISVMFKWAFSRNSGLVAIPLTFRLCLSCCNDSYLFELKWDVVLAGCGLPVLVIQNNRYSRTWEYRVQLMESLWLCSLLLSCCHGFKYGTYFLNRRYCLSFELHECWLHSFYVLCHSLRPNGNHMILKYGSQSYGLWQICVEDIDEYGCAAHSQLISPGNVSNKMYPNVHCPVVTQPKAIPDALFMCYLYSCLFICFKE